MSARDYPLSGLNSMVTRTLIPKFSICPHFLLFGRFVALFEFHIDGAVEVWFPELTIGANQVEFEKSVKLVA
jgi:hypothetical protein